MTAPNAPANPYDGKAFVLQAIDEATPQLFYVVTVDGSIPPAPIRGSFHGSPYDIDPLKTGRDEDYKPGPFVGKEMLELRAKLGGAPAGTDNWPDAVPVATHDDGTPWTAQECLAFRGPIQAGPNAGPDLGPQLKQVDGKIVPIDAPTTSTAAPPGTTTTAAPVGTPTTSADPQPVTTSAAPQPVTTSAAPQPAPATPAHHATSLFARIEQALAADGHAVGSEAHTLYVDARAKVVAVLSHLHL